MTSETVIKSAMNEVCRNHQAEECDSTAAG